jgi:hypothetical protein
MYSVLITVTIACSNEETPTSTSIEDFTGLGEDSGEETTVEPLDFMGSWEDNYGSLIEVTEDEISDAWSNSYAISSYDNEVGWVTAQNNSSNSYNPDLWSKFDWFMAESELYYCQIAYDAADEETAMAQSADSSDLETGCNGFSWSILRTQIDIMGSYTDNWGGEHVVSAFLWKSGASLYAISSFSNEDGWIVAQNGSENSSNPDLWSKLEWYFEADSLYYCQSAYNATDPETAQSTMADKTDLEVGCGGFSWSTLVTID